LSGHQIQFIHLGAAKLTIQAPSQKLCSLQYGYGKLLKWK